MLHLTPPLWRPWALRMLTDVVCNHRNFRTISATTQATVIHCKPMLAASGLGGRTFGLQGCCCGGIALLDRLDVCRGLQIQPQQGGVVDHLAQLHHDVAQTHHSTRLVAGCTCASWAAGRRHFQQCIQVQKPDVLAWPGVWISSLGISSLGQGQG